MERVTVRAVARVGCTAECGVWDEAGMDGAVQGSGWGGMWGVADCGPMRCDTLSVGCGVARCNCVIRCGVVMCETVRCGAVWYGAVRTVRGSAQRGMVPRYVVRLRGGVGPVHTGHRTVAPSYR